jgi:hypothetical protein
MARGFEEGSKTLHLNHSKDWLRENLTPILAPKVNAVYVDIPYNASDECICKLIAKTVELDRRSISYMEDIDRAVQNLDIISDSVHSMKDYKLANLPQQDPVRQHTLDVTDQHCLENTHLEPYIKRAHFHKGMLRVY